MVLYQSGRCLVLDGARMPKSEVITIPADVEADLRAFSVAMAEQDADAVAAYLAHIGIAPSTATGQEAVALPAAFLLGLALLFRLGLWAENNVNPTDANGVALIDVVRAALIAMPKDMANATNTVASAMRSAHGLILDSCAWNAQTEFDCQVALDDLDNLDDDEYVNALAQFLWDNRHQLKRHEGE